MHAQTYVVCTTMRGMKSLDGGTARAIPSYSDVGKWKVSEQLLPVVLMRTKLFLGLSAIEPGRFYYTPM